MNPVFTSIVEGFGFCAEKTGLKASIRNQCQRIVCLLKKECVPNSKVKPGTPLLVDLFGVVEHSGIYLGDGIVAELYGDDLLREVTLKEFLEGDSLIRTGRHIYAACSCDTGLPVSSENAVWNARAYIQGIRTVEYDLFRNNCHLFSISCISGNFQEKQSISTTIKKGGISVGVLTSAVSYFLNQDNIVVWKPVSGWNRKSLKITDPIDDKNEATEEEGMEEGKLASMLGDYTLKQLSEEELEARMNTLKDAGHYGVFAPCLPLLKATYNSFKSKSGKIPVNLYGWLLFGIFYFFSPIDLIPDMVPVFGFSDDAGVFLWILKKATTCINFIQNLPRDDFWRILQTQEEREWVQSIGKPGGERNYKYSPERPCVDFKISKKLLKYFITRHKLPNPLEFVTSVTDQKKTETCETCEKENVNGWTIVHESSWWANTSYVKDPFGNILVKDRDRGKIEDGFRFFAKFYHKILLPCILKDHARNV